MEIIALILIIDMFVNCSWVICLLTAVGLTHSGSSTVHIYTQTIRRTTQLTTVNTVNN